MAHLWNMTDGDEWTTVALHDGPYVFSPSAGTFVRAEQIGPGAESPLEGGADLPFASLEMPTLHRVEEPGDARWVLVAPRGREPLVNGVRLHLGLAVLADRDEIRWPAIDDTGDGGPVYFSTERLPAVVAYPSDIRAGSCPRCKQPLTPGDAAVRCPGCGLWHHASDALPCWTYGEHCAACPQPTALDAGYQWTPEAL